MYVRENILYKSNQLLFRNVFYEITKILLMKKKECILCNIVGFCKMKKNVEKYSAYMVTR